jgi:hypothetical protein
MRLLGIGVVALALAVAAVGVRSAASQPATSAIPVPQPGAAGSIAPTRVSLFGDSLAYQARAEFAARMAERAPGDLDVSTRPATAPCDSSGPVALDLLRRRPQVLVLEYSGNSFTPCMRDRAGRLLRIGSDAWRDRYVEDVRAVLRVARVTGTTVVWATAPPVGHPMASDYPRRIDAAMRALAAGDDHLRVADAGAALAGPGRSFVRSLPCRANEPSCRDGRIVVRAPDGLHFDCHGVLEPSMDCVGYSAGARRFGDALADAAVSRAPASSSRSPRP